MLLCDGFDCDNEEYNKGCVCCNECLVKDCKDRCNQEWETCGHSLIDNEQY